MRDAADIARAARRQLLSKTIDGARTLEGERRRDTAVCPRWGHLGAVSGLCVPVCPGIRSPDTLCPAGRNSQNADPTDLKNGRNGFPADLLTAKYG